MSKLIGNVLLALSVLMTSMTASIYLWGEEEMPECLAKKHEN